MSFKQLLGSTGYAAAWLILPVFAVGCGAALLTYAVMTLLGEILVGGAKKSLDKATARELARRLCLGH
jgi:hypothetical protein